VRIFSEQRSRDFGIPFLFLTVPSTKEDKTEKILSFFWQLLCTCGTGSYGTNQRNSKFERNPFSYVHEEFLVLFYEFAKDPKPSGERTGNLTDNKRHWYKGESGGVESPLLGRGEEELTGEAEEELDSDDLPPTLPINDLLEALNLEPEQEAERKKAEKEAKEKAEREAVPPEKPEEEVRGEEQDESKRYTREVDLYPFQEQVLNFDNNEDPVENLRQFLRLLRGSNRAMST
jgi:hypothetical protein